MQQSEIMGAPNGGSITRSQARAAAKLVKANLNGGSSHSRTGQPVSEADFKRYLGHFGAGAPRNGAPKKFGAKKVLTTTLETEPTRP